MAFHAALPINVMKAEKISITSLSSEQIAALPSATRSRALRRGWVTVGYHQKQCAPAPLIHSTLMDAIYREARAVVWTMIGAGRPFPSWIDVHDLIQEAVIEVWRVSSKPDFHAKKWRQQVMRNRLMKLSLKCRGDADRQRQASPQTVDQQ